jgi:hypothetical protein
MKNFVKWFWIIVFVAAIGFSIVECDLFGNDYEMLNGAWDRGDIVVTFKDSNGVFVSGNCKWYELDKYIGNPPALPRDSKSLTFQGV